MTKQQMALLGALTLMLGVFMPILSVPFLGSVSYFANGRGDGVIALGLGVISLLCAIGHQYRALPWLGLGSLGMLIFTFVNVQLTMREARDKMKADFAGNPFAGIAEGMSQAVQIQWGFGVLLVGAVLLLIAAAKKETSSDYVPPAA